MMQHTPTVGGETAVVCREPVGLTVPATPRYRSVVVQTTTAVSTYAFEPVGSTDGHRSRDTQLFTDDLVSAVSGVFNQIVFCAYGQRAGQVALSFHTESNEVRIELCETGRSWELGGEQLPEVDALTRRGSGLYVARQVLDRFVYAPGPQNRWTLVKRRGGSPRSVSHQE